MKRLLTEEVSKCFIDFANGTGHKASAHGLMSFIYGLSRTDHTECRRGDSRGLVRKADELQRRRAASPTIRVDERQAKVSNAPDDARRRGREPAGLARTEPAESLRGARMLFDDIEVLLVLSEAKSLSQAADQLYMSRPGLSQKIANIESKFGTTLVNRTPSGITLTKAGELVTRFSQNVSDLERVLAAQLAAIDEHFDATLNIGMSFADGVTLLPALVAKYVESHPDTRVHLEAGYEPNLVNQLRSGELDFAILENQPIEPGISNELLGYKKLVFLAPNKAPYNQIIHPVPVQTLLKWPMIIYEWNSGRHMVGNRHFRERYGLSLQDHNMVGRFDTHEAMVEGVKAGLGWATVPDCIAERYRNEPSIVRFKVKTDPMWYPVTLTWPTEAPRSDEARSFAAFIEENIPENYFNKSLEAYVNS